MEINNLPNKEFSVMIKKLKKLRRMDAVKSLTKSRKQEEPKLKNTIPDIKNILQEIGRKLIKRNA